MQQFITRLKTKRQGGRSGEIAEILRAELIASGAPADSPVASTGAVAQRFGVAAMTADKAIRELVNSGVVYRIKGSGTYVKFRQTRQLHIGFIDVANNQFLSESINQVYASYLDHVFEYFRGNGIAVHLLRLAEVQDAGFLETFARELDGFLVSLDFDDPLTMANLKRTGLPVVIYRGNGVVAQPFSQVVYDFTVSVAEMFDTLRLAPDDPPILICEDNINGMAICSLIREYAPRAGFAGVALETEILSFRKRAIDCYKLVRVYRKRFENRIVISLADALTLDLLNAFAEEKMEPGRDFRLVSVGNCEGYGLKLFETPRLSAIDVPNRKMAHTACRLLLELIEHPGDAQHIVRVPTSFIARASSDCRLPEEKFFSLRAR